MLLCLGVSLFHLAACSPVAPIGASDSRQGVADSVTAADSSAETGDSIVISSSSDSAGAGSSAAADSVLVHRAVDSIRAVAHLVSVTLSPRRATIATDDSTLIAVAGTMSDGSRPVVDSVRWSVTAGTISPAGMFVAPDTGVSVTVGVTVGAVTASTIITVTDPPIATSYAAVSASDFVNSIGINVHLGYFDTPYGTAWTSVIRPALLALGIHHVRDAGTVVSDDSWMQSYYGRLQNLAQAGIRVDLAMLPAQGSNDFTSLPQFGRLLSFASGAVESFEGLNEHDLSGRPDWISEMVAFQAALYGAVRSDPRSAALPVWGPSFGQPGNAARVGALGAFLDAGNIHPYPGGQLPMANIATHEQLVAAVMGPHPWIVTETGYHTALAATTGQPPVSEAAMARYVPRVFLDDYLAGISRTYLYELIDEGTDPSNSEQNFGLLRHDGTPKPAFTALANLIAVVRDGAPATTAALPLVIAGDTAHIRHMVLAHADGRYDVLLWQDVSSFDQTSRTSTVVAPESVQLRVSGRPSIAVFDPLSSAMAVATPGRTNRVSVSVADSPIVVELTP